MALRDGDIEHAEDRILSTCAAHPEQAIFHKRAADLFLAKQEFNKALTAIERAIALEPKTLMYVALRGLIYARAHDYTAASQSFCQVLDGPSSPQFPGLYFMAGEALQNAGQPEAAAQKFSQGLKLAPMSWKRQVALAKLEIEMGDPERAITRMRWTLQWADERPPVVKTLTEALVALGRTDEAIAVLGHTKTRYPDKVQFGKLYDKLVEKTNMKKARALQKNARKSPNSDGT
jgi:predicted Zn-dependent protease